MDNNRSEKYAAALSSLLQAETVSEYEQPDKSKFKAFHSLLKDMFPTLFSACELWESNGSLLLKWKGSDSQKEPVLLMNHHDVVEAPGEWKYPPFSGEIAEGKVWGRGAIDDKGELWAMLTAAEELATEGFVPERDVYFESSCTEETDGEGADTISKMLLEKDIHFYMVLDEGGMIMYDPIGGADGTFAVVGMGEKTCVDMRFVARSAGGHASTPTKNTPLVRLGKFMAEMDDTKIFKVKISPTVRTMFKRIAPKCKGVLKLACGHPVLFGGIIAAVMPKMSPAAGAMLKTTIAFTMSKGSGGYNVLPQEAWVTGNMRCSHHQNSKKSIDAVTKIASKYDIETQIIDPGFDSPVSSCKSKAFKTLEKAVSANFPGVITMPYIMTGASDSRYFTRVCDNVFRFAPFLIDDRQLESIHGVNENVDISVLAPAVDFYKYIIKEV